MYYYNGSVYIEDEDQCQTCANFVNDVNCPLLQALGMGLVTLNDNMIVTNCGFYKEFKRNLRIIRPGEKDSPPPPSNDSQPPLNNIRRLKPS
jgi:hypothetical protein